MEHARIVRQSGVIPYRFGSGGLEILLVTSSSGSRWIVPKGHVERGLTAVESAIKEAYEEAGIVGVAEPRAAGSIRHARGSERHLISLYPMSVVAVLPEWPEMHRERFWAFPEHALAMVGHLGMARCIRALCARLQPASLREAAA